MLSVAPPHTVASLKSRIVKIEGTILYQNMQIFKNMDGEELMNDNDHLAFQADSYPGCEEDDPIAIVCGEQGVCKLFFKYMTLVYLCKRPFTPPPLPTSK